MLQSKLQEEQFRKRKQPVDLRDPANLRLYKISARTFNIALTYNIQIQIPRCFEIYESALLVLLVARRNV